MPHDCNGQLLEVGNEVVFRAKVVQIYPAADTCNVVLEAVQNPTGCDYSRTITITAALVEKVPELETVGEAADE